MALKKLTNPFSNAGLKWQEDQKNMYRPVINTPVVKPVEQQAVLPTAGKITEGITNALISSAQPAVSATPAAKAASSSSAVYKAYRQAVEQQEQAIRRNYAEREYLLKQHNELLKNHRVRAMNAAIAANDRQAAEILRRAYVEDMLYRRNLPQQLKARGLSGGASETAVMNLQNNYTNNRNKIKADTNNNNSAIRQAYRQKIDEYYADYIKQLYELRGQSDERLQKISRSLAAKIK